MKIADLMALMAFNPFRGKLRGPEDEFAIQCGSQLRAWAIEGRLRATFTCIPHEVGAVSRKSPAFKVAQARYAKELAKGLIAGSGDYVFVWAGGGGWIEIKSPTGSLSPDQRLFRAWCVSRGAPFAVARNIAELQSILIGWGVLDERDERR